MQTATVTSWTPHAGMVESLRGSECEQCWLGKIPILGTACDTCHGTGRVLGISMVVVPVELPDHETGFTLHNHTGGTASFKGDRCYVQRQCPLGPVGDVVEVQMPSAEFTKEGFTLYPNATPGIIARLRVTSIDPKRLGEVTLVELRPPHKSFSGMNSETAWNRLYPFHPWDPKLWVWVIGIESEKPVDVVQA